MLFLASFFWGLVLLSCFIGWGFLVSRIVFGKSSVILGLKAVIGLSFVLLLGGVLNLFEIITKQSIFVLVFLGCLLFLIQVWDSRFLMKDYFSKFNFSCFKNLNNWLLILLLGFIVFNYSLNVFNQKFHGYDDYQTYLAFPAKMIQTGSLGIDPYAETRVVTSLGGKYFLDSLVLSVLPFNALHLIDNGVSYLILLLLVYGAAKKLVLSNFWSLSLMFTASLIMSPSGNVTSMITSIVIFFALLLYFFKDIFFSKNNFSNSLIFSLLLFSFIVLKSNIIPFAALFILAMFVFDYLQSGRRFKVIKPYILIGVLTFLFLLPWMLSMKLSAGTLLYPIFGTGFHGAAYGSLPAAYSEWGINNTLPLVFDIITNLIFWLCLGLAIILFYTKDLSKENKQIIFLVFAVVALGILVNGFLTGGYGVYRYTFAFVYPGLIFLIIMAAFNKGLYSRLFNLQLKTFTLIIVGILIGVGFNNFLANTKNNFDKLLYSVNTKNAYLDRIDEKIVESYQAMQKAVPEKETVLVRLQFPFLLDFKRNQIFLTDYVGGSSPPPGIPLYKGAEALSDYLLSQNIKYVAYSYKSEIGFTREIFIYQLKESGNWRSYNPWLRAEVENTLDFQANLKELGETRKRIYDDGEIFVLDLSEKI